MAAAAERGRRNIVDWSETFEPTVSLLEIFLRGTIIYFALFVMLRFLLKRQAGEIGVTDLLVIVLIADAAQNGMSADYTSVTEAFVLVGNDRLLELRPRLGGLPISGGSGAS